LSGKQSRGVAFAALKCTNVVAVLTISAISIERTAIPERKPTIGPAGSTTIVKFLVSAIPSVLTKTVYKKVIVIS
jgi:hypothetical protein